jgi:hypothetical protein
LTFTGCMRIAIFLVILWASLDSYIFARRGLGGARRKA